MEPVIIGIIGCGVISDAYLKGAAGSRFVNVKAVADIRQEMAKEKAAKFGCQAMTVDQILSDPDIEIILNLTVPAAHAQVDLDILDAGKHIYSKKPLTASLKEAVPVMEKAAALGLRVGCAPDTFFGAAHQASRQIVDEEKIGRIVGGSVAVASRGMEHWHPDPRFFYQPGGGPHIDIGPYYVTQLINLLGPVETVSAHASKAFEKRTISSEKLNGTTFDVAVPTTINGSLQFACGANLSLTMSWDVLATKRPRMEIYGTEGSLQNPDPNHFGGIPEIVIGNGEWRPVSTSDFAFGQPNRTTIFGQEVADYRVVGLIDMAVAIRTLRPHRANADLAYHVLDVLESLETSSQSQNHVRIQNQCRRPAPLAKGADENVLLEPVLP
jgi:predicted dehydrogenase